MKKVIIRKKAVSEQEWDFPDTTAPRTDKHRKGNWVKKYKEPTDTVPSGRAASDTQKDSASTTQAVPVPVGDKLVRATIQAIFNSDEFNHLVRDLAPKAIETFNSELQEDHEEDIIEHFSKNLDEQLFEEEIDTLLEEYGLHLNEGAKQFVSSLKRKLGVPLVIGGIMAASLFGTGAQADTPTTFPSVEAAESYVEKSYGTDAKATIEKGTKSMKDLFMKNSPIVRDQNGEIDWLASLQLDDGTIVTFTDAE